jgi:tRNA-splicing endonuclease subunit Sen2
MSAASSAPNNKRVHGDATKSVVKRQRNARRMPKQKRFAPREAPGLPGRGAVARYTAYLSDGAVWILDADAARDLSQRGSYGKGILSRSVPDFAARQQRLSATLERSLGVSERKLAHLDAQRRASSAADAEHGAEYDPLAVPVRSAELVAQESEVLALRSELEYTATPLLGGDGEPLLLAFEEAFFLQYALQCLDVLTEDGVDLNVDQAWRLYGRLDPRFAEKYVAYHFHRSHGWCPKQGIKFGSDWILYKKGPLYHHASYQVIVTRLARADLGVVGADDHSRMLTWAKVHHLNRLAEGVQKELLLTYVVDPPLGTDLSAAACIPLFSVREVALKRFIPSAEEKQLESEM